MHRVEAALGKDGWLLYLYSLSVLSSSDSSSSAVAVVVVAVDDDDEEGVLLLGIATLLLGIGWRRSGVCGCCCCWMIVMLGMSGMIGSRA